MPKKLKKNPSGATTAALLKVAQPSSSKSEEAASKIRLADLTKLRDLEESLNEKLKEATRQGYKNSKKTYQSRLRRVEGEISTLEERIKAFDERAADRRRSKASEDSEQTSVPRTASIGMTRADRVIFSKFNEANSVVSIWRPVNPSAKKHLQDGAMGKGLNIKAKSSEFGPISGLIPLNAELSKMSSDVTLATKLHDKTKQTEERLRKDGRTYQEYMEKIEARKEEMTQKEIQSFNDQLLVSSVKVADHDENTIYYLEEDGEVAWQINAEGTKVSPLFIVQKRGAYYLYNDLTKEFDIEYGDIGTNKPVAVEVLAYRQLELGKNAQGELEIRESKKILTADYDELVSSPKKFFPFHNNDEIRTMLSRKDFVRALKTRGKITSKDLVTQLVLNYEIQAKNIWRETFLLEDQPYMGLVTEEQLTIKAVLKMDTGSHTSHGPEVNNPYPEPFSDREKYLVFLPEGKITALRGEENICRFINKKRREGFPLAVNPKWGWEMDENGDLYVPEVKFNWINVYKFIDELERKSNVLAGEILGSYGFDLSKENRRALKNSIEASEFLTDSQECIGMIESREVFITEKSRESFLKLHGFLKQLQLEERIIKIEAKILQLRTEPCIIYSQHPDSEGDTFEESEEIAKIAHDIQLREKALRNRQIQSFEAQRDEKTRQYKEDYGEESIVLQELLSISDIRNDSSKRLE